MLQLCVFLIFSAVSAEIDDFRAVSAEIDDIDVKYMVQMITQSLEEVFRYNQPNNANEYQTVNQSHADYGTFDYIIVGAGSSGAVLASRLSENNNLTILLLEAGGEESTFSDIPAMMMHLHGTKFNWNHRTVPQKTCCLGMVEKTCLHPRGKGLGGSSIINAGMYVRGNIDDYDSWARAGNSGWSFHEVLPYFIKSENSQIDGDYGYHGIGGPLNVEYHIPNSPVAKAFIEANQILGRKIVDYNGKEQLGVAYTQFNLINGHRLSTGKAFLSKAKRRKNLKVLPYSYAKKIMINDNKEAYGVVFDHKKTTSFAHAKKEIIVSAGAIGSPHLLMLSGIGLANVLSPLNIPVVHELPVGKNYQDHPTIFALLFTTNYSEPIKSFYEYSKDYLNGIGGFTIGANAQAVAFLRTKSATTRVGVPNIEAILIPQNSSNDFFQRAFNYANETYNAHWPQVDSTKTFSVFLMLLHPKSIGSISLRSSNPYDYPNIDANFLSDENDEDIQTLYEGINMLQEMIETGPFKKIDTKLHYSVLPSCSDYKYYSKEQWFCQIRQLTTHIYHPVGTCKMAPHPNEGGVVDNELKVHGVTRLRVADASIIPESTSGHTNAPAIMIGEKLADILKQQN